MTYLSDSITQLIWHLPVTNTILAQVNDPDLLGQIQRAWAHFVQTGQIWALLIGLTIGYIFRNFTTYS